MTSQLPSTQPDQAHEDEACEESVSENHSDSACEESVSENHSDSAIEQTGGSTGTTRTRARGATRRQCPRCGSPLVRMHRRFADRMVSMVNPVRRYACTNHLCAHETILWKDSTLGQRPIVAAAGLVGAALAGAVAMGLGLYISSDESTRAEVRGAYSGVMQHDAGDRPNAKLELPVASQLLEHKVETTSMLEAKNQIDDLNAGSAAHASVLSPPPKEAEPGKPRSPAE